jgi:hypothetical protein
MSSTSPSTTIDQNEQTQTIMHRSEFSLPPSEEIPDSSMSSSSSEATTTLPNQILTENDHEDNLMELIDELIRNFLSRPNRRSPYCSFFRWIFDDNASNLSYSVVVKIDEPSRLIEMKDLC